MKNHILDCAEVSCRVERVNGRVHRDYFVGHFILTKKSIIFLSFLSIMDRLTYGELDKDIMRQAMTRPGSVHLPIVEITSIRKDETPECGPEFTVQTTAKLGNKKFTFRCAAFCGQESEDFEAVAYPYIAGQVRRLNGYASSDSTYTSTDATGMGVTMAFEESEHARFRRLLDVGEDASPEEIKQAYRDLSMVWHPDRHPERLKELTTRKMQELNEAYRSLAVN